MIASSSRASTTPPTTSESALRRTEQPKAAATSSRGRVADDGSSVLRTAANNDATEVAANASFGVWLDIPVVAIRRGWPNVGGKPARRRDACPRTEGAVRTAPIVRRRETACNAACKVDETVTSDQMRSEAADARPRGAGAEARHNRGDWRGVSTFFAWPAEANESSGEASVALQTDAGSVRTSRSARRVSEVP